MFPRTAQAPEHKLVRDSFVILSVAKDLIFCR
jgi:hypothetical protein